mmetsp:Transcript_19454/g.30563  ORF Transcript_19454/g.30563 Transcript_19454/m.30563 type:complete len:103 (+) Transcript_19454:43-351(+)
MSKAKDIRLFLWSVFWYVCLQSRLGKKILTSHNQKSNGRTANSNPTHHSDCSAMPPDRRDIAAIHTNPNRASLSPAGPKIQPPFAAHPPIADSLRRANTTSR